MRILVLDDDCDVMQPIILTYNKNHEFVFAVTPNEAEAAMEKKSFDVMLLDGSLGWSNTGPITGPDTLRRWKTEGRQLPPVYMISSEERYQTEGIKMGAIGSIQKIWIRDASLLEAALVKL